MGSLGEEILGLSIKAISLTPDSARQLLKSNKHNRKVSPAVVSKYARDIADGKWMLTASGIGIDTNGVLCDGQHRLLAIVEANVPAPVIVVSGLAPKSQLAVDGNKVRTRYDSLYLAGAAKHQHEVYVATFLASMRLGTKALSNSEVGEELECRRDAILAIVGMMSKSRGVARVGFLSAVVEYYEIAPKEATSFMSDVTTGEMLTMDSPAMRIRKYLLGETMKMSYGGGMQEMDYKKTKYAINAYHNKQKIVMVRECDKFYWEEN